MFVLCVLVVFKIVLRVCCFVVRLCFVWFVLCYSVCVGVVVFVLCFVIWLFHVSFVVWDCVFVCLSFCFVLCLPVKCVCL